MRNTRLLSFLKFLQASCFLLFWGSGFIQAVAFLPDEGSGLTPEVRQILNRIPEGHDMFFIDDMAFRMDDFAKSGFKGARWTDGIIYYEFDANVTSSQRTKWINAANEWAAVATISFVQRTAEKNYIHVFDGGGNWSYVGMIGGRQDMSIASWNYRFVIVHEIGHALGMAHEHQRTDRDSYVSINMANIQDDYEDNFTKWSTTDYGGYDFDSVMHYDQCAFSIDCPPGYTCACSNKCITVLPPNQSWQNYIGQRDHLSSLDQSGMAARYYSSCGNTGVTLWMPAHQFAPGDPCGCKAFVCNSEGHALNGFPLFVILEAFGHYYFAPGFNPSYDNYLSKHPVFNPGSTAVQVLAGFNWPANAGDVSGVMWYAALTNPGVTDLIGEMDTWTFGWSR